MNLLTPMTYLPGALACIAVWAVAAAVEQTLRWFRPEKVTCAVCRGTEGIDVAVHTVDGLATFHEACVDDAVVNIKPFTGTHRELLQDIDMQAIYPEDITR